MKSLPRVPFVLGWAGVLPFLACAILVWSPLMHEAALQGILLYGAIILSFLGGVHWGLELRQSESQITLGSGYSLSVIPALVAFLAFYFQSFLSLLIIAMGFLGLLVHDLQRVREGRVPAWYGVLRLQLTTAVLLCLLSAVIATGINS